MIKLARALWIVPLSAVTAITLKSKARIQWPWFILLFCLAALLNTLFPAFKPAFGALNHLGNIGLTVTLFLIGTGLNKETIRLVGVRPLLQGLVLWIIVGAGTLALVLLNWIDVSGGLVLHHRIDTAIAGYGHASLAINCYYLKQEKRETNLGAEFSATRNPISCLPQR